MLSTNGDIELELQHAERARQSGNEGQARVCARRAAGIAAREFLSQHGVPVGKANAYSALIMLAEYPDLSPISKTAIEHLTVHLTPAFTLPVNADLIADARSLIGELYE